MLPKEIKELLEDIKLSTRKITDREIVLFDRRCSKEEIDELVKLNKILDKNIVENNTEAVNKITTTIAKIVRKHGKE